MPKVIVTKLAPGKFLGVLDASKALGVHRNTIYDYLRGDVGALGTSKRERLEIIDHTRRTRRSRA